MSRSLQKVSCNLHKDVDDDVSAILTQITYSCNAVSQSESLNESVFEGNNDYQNGRIIISRSNQDATHTNTDRNVTPTRTVRDATSARPVRNATSVCTDRHVSPTRTVRDTTSARTVRDATSERDATSTRSDGDTTRTRTGRDANTVRDATPPHTNRDVIYTRTDRDAISAPTNQNDFSTLTDQSAIHADTYQDTSYTNSFIELRKEPESDSDHDENDRASIGDVFEEIRQKYGDELANKLSAYRQSDTEEIDTEVIEDYIDKIPRKPQTEETDTNDFENNNVKTPRKPQTEETDTNDFENNNDKTPRKPQTEETDTDDIENNNDNTLRKLQIEETDTDDTENNNDKTPRETQTEDIDPDDIENYINNIPNEKQTKEPKISCATCCRPRRVEHASWLEKGQHIRFPGEHLKFTFKKKVIPVYRHHAIIKEVKSTAENYVKLDLIHFLKQDKKISIHRTTNTYNLEKDDIDIIDYERPRYDADTIVQRAESMLQEEGVSTERKEFKSYNVILRNCEHFASWCVVGESESFQAKDFKKTSFKVLNKAAGIGCKIGRFVTRFLYNASDEIAASFNVVKLPGVLLVVSAFIYLVYTICMTIYYRRKYSKRKMCKVCFKREVISLWTSFGAFCVTSGISYILVHFLLPLLAPTPVGIPLLLVIVLICLFLQWGLGKVIKALMWPYACDKIEVKRLSQITPGSMITFKYFGKQQAAIVTEKHTDSDDLLTGNITFVHYGLRGTSLFGTRHVKEDVLRLNVEDNEKDVKLVDCSALKTFPPDVVVARVKARIGETNWSLFTNRSVHLCFDCLVHEEYGQENLTTQEESVCQTHPKRKSTLYLGRKEIHLRSDLKVGHIVKYFGQTGIVVSLEECTEESQQKFPMEMIVYKDFCGTRRKFSVDLKKKRLYIEKYHPAHCYPMAERVRRACEKEGKYCEFWRQYSFLESCILKE